MKKILIGLVLLMIMICCTNGNTVTFLKKLSKNFTKEQSYDKRSESLEERPCDCETRVEWTDLGENVYPRHLRETKCISTHCWFGHSRCNPILYTVKVLTNNPLPFVDPMLPEGLRSDWTFVDKTVSVGCLCSR
ncbi:Hypothetical predicted protein [Mytilus galloprovincialis]|uniref:Uncharacterized protein n=1 Tax=Mytilus galloprovincialis TaxID=29158 RepID=A0A8B6GKS4_MYTGA|nr:Hypothetical predicted protein [Mytilus galloprovincialis]